MPRQHKESEGHATPKNRRESAREEKQRGQVVREKGSSGAPQGGQIEGRQGDQEGTRR